MTNAYSIDVSKGSTNSVLSNQWASRPDDERFLSLDALHAATLKSAQESHSEKVPDGTIEACSGVDSKSLTFKLPYAPAIPASNIAFNQICTQVGAPSRYLATLPAELVAKALNYGFAKEDSGSTRAAYLRRLGFSGDQGQQPDFIRGFTSEKYGRIYDHDIVKAIIDLNEKNDNRWKVPGVIDWSKMKHNPNVDITKDTTTLYASDRDLFVFLCDDRNPIEVGKLANGDPDYLFRGFYASNSEIGYSRFSLAKMYLRGVCQNRNLWGVEGFSELRIRHTKGAPVRFLEQATPMLAKFAEAGTDLLVKGVHAAKAAVVATDEDERETFLRKLGFSKKQAETISKLGEIEEGKLPESIWDMAQGITALARTIPHQDKRIEVERMAGDLLDTVAVAA